MSDQWDLEEPNMLEEEGIEAKRFKKDTGTNEEPPSTEKMSDEWDLEEPNILEEEGTEAKRFKEDTGTNEEPPSTEKVSDEWDPEETDMLEEEETEEAKRFKEDTATNEEPPSTEKMSDEWDVEEPDVLEEEETDEEPPSTEKVSDEWDPEETDMLEEEETEEAKRFKEDTATNEEPQSTEKMSDEWDVEEPDVLEEEEADEEKSSTEVSDEWDVEEPDVLEEEETDEEPRSTRKKPPKKPEEKMRTCAKEEKPGKAAFRGKGVKGKVADDGLNVPGTSSNLTPGTSSQGTSQSGGILRDPGSREKLENAMYKRAIDRLRRIPKWMLRRGINQKHYQFLPPKDAVESIQALRPGCEFDIHEESSNPPMYNVQVILNGCVLGEARGYSKEIALETAAEGAIKASVVKFLSESSARSDSSDSEEESDVPGFNNHFSWNALASYAMHEVLKDWERKGVKIPPKEFYKTVKGRGPSGKAVANMDVPPNATKLHPCALLNSLRPDSQPFEVDRANGTNLARNTVVGYSIDGEIYTGKGGSKRGAKKEAARAALSYVFGVNYDK